MSTTDDAPEGCGGINGVGTSPIDVTLTVPIAVGAILFVGLVSAAASLFCERRRLPGFSKPVMGCAPATAAHIDMSYGELCAIGLYLLASGGPVIASGVQSQSAPTVASFLGFQIQLNLAIVILPATRTSLWVTLFDISFERAVRYHRFLAWWAVVRVPPLNLSFPTCTRCRTRAPCVPLSPSPSGWHVGSLPHVSYSRGLLFVEQRCGG